MKLMLDRFSTWLDSPLFPWSRAVLLALLIPMAASFWFPLWRVSMTAPQYPNGLYVDIYSYKVEGGDEGNHLTEINILNHYIGMKHIDKALYSELDWLPFAFGALMLLALRTATVGTVRSLLDLSVLTVYTFGFAFFRYGYKLWVLGHTLDTAAPMHVEPFMPVIIGTKQVANFLTAAWPRWGALLAGVFIVGVMVLTFWHLVAGRRRASREQKTAHHPAGAHPAH